MNVGLYQAASALNANARWQEIISENLAASSIPGYKKQELSFAAVQAGLAMNPARAALPHPATVTNFQPGEMRQTGVSTDVAIEGRGFIPIQLPDGSTAYTRDGELQINSSGQLITKQGFAVLGDGGPIQLDLNNHTPVSISNTGEVSQGSDLKGTIKLVDFSDPNLLTPLNHGLLAAKNPQLKQIESPDATLRQGFLEAAKSRKMRKPPGSRRRPDKVSDTFAQISHCES